MISEQEKIKNSLNNVENLLSSVLTGDELEQTVNSMCLEVVNAGGKRIRPRLALASFFAINNEQDTVAIEHFAAACELLHTATLIHDDVIDKATIRRGKKTLNETDGNHAAVLAGDYLFTKCFICLNNIDSKEIFSMLNQTLASLVSGEIAQLKNQGKQNITLDDYLHTIYCKTGALFELATSGAAIIKGADKKIVDALKEYGKQLGIAFQVADDMLDYSSDDKELGKAVGEDLIDGRITLPLIYALDATQGKDREELEKAISDGNFSLVFDYIQKTNSLTKSHEFALKASDKAKDALKVLKDSEFKSILLELSDKAVNRTK